MWNSGRERPEFCDVLERTAQITPPEARMWRNRGCQPERTGHPSAGESVGARKFRGSSSTRAHKTSNFCWTRSQEYLTCNRRFIFSLCFSLSQLLAASCQACLVRGFTERRDEGLWRCLRLLGTDLQNARSRGNASVPLSLEGLGLRKTTQQATYWTSRSQPLHDQRTVVEKILGCVAQRRSPRDDLAIVAHQLAKVEGFEVPSWDVRTVTASHQPHEKL